MLLSLIVVVRIPFPMVHPCIRVECRIFMKLASVYAAVRMRKDNTLVYTALHAVICMIQMVSFRTVSKNSNLFICTWISTTGTRVRVYLIFCMLQI